MAGLEPVTSAVTGQRSNQLSYTPALGEQGEYANTKGRSSFGWKTFLARKYTVRNPGEVVNRGLALFERHRILNWFDACFLMKTHKEKQNAELSGIKRVQKVLTPKAKENPIKLLNKIRAADAKEVGVGNPAEETCCYPNKINVANK